MADRIQTTHVGSLPRPAKVIELNHKRADGEKVDEADFDRELKGAVVDAVARQKEAGIDLVNDGEFGHTMGWDYDYGSWWSYVVRRLNGVEVEAKPLWMQTLTAQIKARPGAQRFRGRRVAGSPGLVDLPRRLHGSALRAARCPSSS